MREKILSFIRSRLLSVSVRPDRFVLAHSGTGQGSTLATLPHNGGDIEDSAIGIANEVWESASSHVETCTRPQRYVVVAKKDDTTIGSHPFRLAPEASGLDTEDSEPPTTAGLLSQLMRHNEALMRMMQLTTAQTMGALAADNKDLRTNNAKLVKRLEKDAELRESLTSMAHERDLETAKAYADEERKNRLLGHAEKLLPAIWDRIQGNDPRMLRVLNSLDDNQQFALLGILNDAQKEDVLRIIADREKVAASVEKKEADNTAIVRKED